jgi:RNA polymerase sigma-70 factor (ECF subfamily)
MNMLATKPGARTLGRVRVAQFRHRNVTPDIVRDVDSPSSPDSVLVARIVAGDEEALTEVWQRHGPVVFGHARRLTRDASIAEDIAQEVFVAFWTNPDRFDPERGSLRAYLGVHARRRAIDRLRQDTRRSNREQRHYSLNASGECAPDAIEEQAEMSGAVREAISRLPQEQREAVELAYFGGLTHCEIARRLGIPEGTAKSRLRLAQTKLRAWLAPALQEVV